MFSLFVAFHIFIYIFFYFINSIKHQYSKWDEKNPKVTTCNPDTKITPVSHTHQEVAKDTDVVFTYDVSFEVRLAL